MMIIIGRVWSFMNECDWKWMLFMIQLVSN